MKLDGKEIQVGDKLFVIGKGYQPVIGAMTKECEVGKIKEEGPVFYFTDEQNTMPPGYRTLYWEQPIIRAKPVTVSQTLWIGFYEDGSVIARANFHPIAEETTAIASKKITIEYTPGEFDE